MIGILGVSLSVTAVVAAIVAAATRVFSDGLGSVGIYFSSF